MVNESDENQKPTTLSEALGEDQIALSEQQNRLIENEQKSHPLVAEKVPFAVLAAEYDPETSSEFLVKANELAETYSDIRFIRGDGNCFYRAVLVGLTEIMLRDSKRLNAFIATCKEWTQKLIKMGFPDYTTTDFCDFCIEFLENINSGKFDKEAAFAALNDDGTANYVLMFFRLITSGFLKENAEEYAPFIMDGQTVSQYCENEIEAMWKDADHLAIIACARAAGTKVRIEYMDRNVAPNGGYHYDVPDGEQEPEIYVLYRPGHYDLIYKKH